jgi:hypothetical protein
MKRTIMVGMAAVLAVVGGWALHLTQASATTVSAAQAAPAAFVHPGVLVSRAQLDFVKAKVAAGAQPWTTAFTTMRAHGMASLSRVPKPREIVECGYFSVPDYGCGDEHDDATAAYTDALAWYYSGDSRYAQKAIQIMDAWSATIKAHTNKNAQLQAGWAGTNWARAGEIIRYTYSSWPNVNRFAAMLRDVYLPEVIVGSATSNGNKELSMMEAAVGISVFLDDRTTYDRAIAIYRHRVPAYFYLTSDGPLPKAPGGSIDTKEEIVTYWQGQTTFVDGLSQETCRDFTHAGYGIAATANIAETTRIQGQDLYPEIKDRLRFALAFQSRYQLGEAVPTWLCGGHVTLGLGPVTEIGYNALHNRMGIEMPKTKQLTEQRRPAGTDYLFNAWETLTHADNPA